MYYPRYRSYRRSQSSLRDYLMPFLLIIAVGFILVLLYNLWNAVFGDENVNAAYLHIVEGSVDVRTWGDEDFVTLSSDVLILQGDEVVTAPGTKAIVEFFDGTIMRMGPGTDVNFEEFVGDEQLPEVTVMLVDGNIWFNKIYKNADETLLTVKLSNATVSSKEGSNFEVESGIDQTVRVINGKDVDVDILDEEGKKSVANEQVGIGQEMVLSEEAFDRFWKFQSPEVVTAVSADFEAGDFAVWNSEEDKNPTKFEKSLNGNQFVRVDPEVADNMMDQFVEVPPEEEAVTEDVVAEEITESTVEAPALTSVNNVTEADANGFFVVKDNLAVITGAVNGATQLMVNDYVLQKFTSGDSTWTYFANADYALMKEGENIYNVYAVDAEGNKSAALVVKVLYQPEKAAEETPAVEETSSDT